MQSENELPIKEQEKGSVKGQAAVDAADVHIDVADDASAGKRLSSQPTQQRSPQRMDSNQLYQAQIKKEGLLQLTPSTGKLQVGHARS